MENWKNTKCGTCAIQRQKPICNSCMNYHFYRPMTNAQKIRSMTDEELAEFLMKVNLAYAEPCMTGQEDCKHPNENLSCMKCFLEYLKRNVK